MTDQELTHYVQQVSQKYFQRPFRHQANFNRRLKTTGGRYHLTDHHIDINLRFAEDSDKSILLGIVKHELCHYHLHLAGGGYRHRDRDFKQWLVAVGGSRYAPAPIRVAPEIQYQCQQCGQKYLRRRHLNTQRYVCSKCGGHLQLVQQGRIQKCDK
ncbi:SprT family protein [Loigolactobacillus jiayinensis]|uniref:SprT family protein n=1 Tax=Loigolactobacillus jiayinensis TaxID=2486016 RepID=A0ABW1RDC1_9LACO|nr:SprT family protein [Loigolactobacillus jiayinensis]